ncbi:MAG: YjbQ family protein [Deltaproteobacteria bacterium]|nr:YjbQ family protein [Deltaproteobacteria bacterium]
MTTLAIDTTARCEMIDITARVAEAVRRTGVRDGVCHVFTPHTTAAVTINENADPDVPRDILTVLDRIVPLSGDYRHGEGNTAAHVKASLIGASQTVLIKDGGLVLGTWQSLFFCEFDGPRTRKVLVGVTG